MIYALAQDKWLRSKQKAIADFGVELNSAAAIEGAKLTQQQRSDLNKMLQDILSYIDKLNR